MEEQHNKEKQLKQKRAFLIIMVGLVILGVLGTILFKFKGGKADGGGGGSSTAALIPIWVAVFVPLMAAKKKKEGQQKTDLNNKRGKKFLLYAALFVGLMVLATILTWYFKTI
jgi:hypothetical protein